MSRIAELIKEKCPNGVEYKYLSHFMIRRKEKCNEVNSKFTVYSVTNTRGLVKSDDFHDNSIYSSNVSNYLKVYPNDFVYNPARLNVKSLARMKNNEIGIVSPMYVVFYIDNKIILNEYFEYLIFSYKVYNRILSFVEQGARFRFDYNNWNKIKVPVPPLEVQEEIVKILDKFGKLEAELEAELEARKQQYEFWSKRLLNNNGKLYNLEDVLKIKNGKDYKHLKKGNIPVYGSGGVMTYVDKFMYDKESVLIPRKGSLGNVFYLDIPFWNVDTIYYTEINNSIVIPKYVFYYIKNIHLENFNIAGGVPSMTQATLNKLKIPILSLEEQQRIVNILDKFDKLVNDISEGLPSEIELRKKQYEYYRNKLLSFKELINE